MFSSCNISFNYVYADTSFKRSHISGPDPFHLFILSFNLEIIERSKRSVKDFHHNTSEENKLLNCPSQVSCCETCVSEIKLWRRCQCDSFCTFFNDCCADYQQYQGAKTIKNPGKLEYSQLSCINTILNTAIWVVTKCPDNKSSNEISLKCEKANEESWHGNDIRLKIPVHGKNNLVYRNEYCAKCNGDNRIQHFVVKINCNILPPRSLTTINEKVMFALKYCENDSITFEPRDDYKTRACFPHLVKDCANTNPYYERCVTGPVGVVASNGTNYRNIWCVLCTGRQYPTCGPHIHNIIQKPPKITPLSFVLDITKNGYSTRVRVKCRKKLFYDAKLEICSRLKSRKLPKTRNIEKFLVAIWFDSKKSTVSWISKKSIYSSLKMTFNISISQMNKLYFIKRQPNYFVIVLRLRLTPEQTLDLTKKDSDEIDLQKKIHSTNHGRALSTFLPIKRLLFFTTEFNISIGRQIFTVFKTTYRQLTCINKQRYTSRQYILLPNGSYYINSSGTMYEERQVYKDPVKQDISVCERVVIYYCQGYQMSLKDNEYVRFENLSVFYNGTNKMYSFGEYEIENGKVLVCLFPSVKWNSIPPNNTQIILTDLTLIGFVLSLFALILVILTYSIFSELRSVPGKNILNLSASLFISQFLWLTAVGQSSMPVLCHVTAIVEHYLFLVSFVAMAIIAYHTYLGFSSKNVSRNVQRDDENRKFLKYCIVTWCVPAIFVGTCFVLDQQGIYTIYRSDKVCWFENKKAQKYLFVLPIAVILSFNAIFFILTVIHIHMERSKTRLVSSSHTRPTLTMLWIYLKIATLMGFSWLFGFLDLIVHGTLVFSYLFVIFTSLQGVCIAIAFIMNKRIFKMYKDLMRKKLNNRCKTTDVSRNSLKTSTKCTQL